MAYFLNSVSSMRPDAAAVWQDPEVSRRLSWYRRVMTGRAPAKFMLCRKISTGIELERADSDQLWTQHTELSRLLNELVVDIENGSEDAWTRKDVRSNLLDLKTVLVNKMLQCCGFCEWKCNVDRANGKVGFCRLDKTASVSSYFHHYGEEAPLIGVERKGGSGTIFFESCTARCVFCQNWDISQPKSKASLRGEAVSPVRLAEIADDLACEGAGNINYVGGEPTPNLHTIVESLRHMTQSVPLVWNSNMYCSMDTMEILADIIDFWLPDFKFWDDECAKRLMWVGAKASYREVVKRNHLFAAEHGSMIIRHLALPNHLGCCTQPILKFIADTIGERVLVNVMSQYYPANLVKLDPKKYQDIARNLSGTEVRRAYDCARSLGLKFEQVS